MNFFILQASSSGHLEVMTLLLLQAANIHCWARETSSDDLKDCMVYALGHSYISAKQKEERGCVWLLLAAGILYYPYGSYNLNKTASRVYLELQRLLEFCSFSGMGDFWQINGIVC